MDIWCYQARARQCLKTLLYCELDELCFIAQGAERNGNVKISIWSYPVSRPRCTDSQWSPQSGGIHHLRHGAYLPTSCSAPCSFLPVVKLKWSYLSRDIKQCVALYCSTHYSHLNWMQGWLRKFALLLHIEIIMCYKYNLVQIAG